MALRIMNAAGTVKRPEETDLLDAPVTDITVGSITPDMREGNPGNVFWQSDDRSVSLNSLGLPNPGSLPWVDWGKGFSRLARARGKRFRMSIAAFDENGYCQCAAGAHAAEADEIEVNFGCPNVWSEGEQKRIGSFDLPYMGRVLSLLEHTMADTGIRFSVKLSPYADPCLLAEAAALIGEHAGLVEAVVTSNTFPNGIAMDEGGKPILSTRYGGLGGAPLKHIALGQVVQFRERLPAAIEVIGVGGIFSGGDVADFLAAGASAVQVATAYLAFGPKIFGEILAGLPENVAAGE